MIIPPLFLSFSFFKSLSKNVIKQVILLKCVMVHKTQSYYPSWGRNEADSGALSFFRFECSRDELTMIEIIHRFLEVVLGTWT